MRSSLVVTAMLLLVACNAGDDEEEHQVFNKGCYGKGPNCGFTGESSPAETHPVPQPPTPSGCPAARTDAPRSDLSSTTAHAILPGEWTSCPDGYLLVVSVDANGRLEASGETMSIGACGDGSCAIGWGERGVGALRVWSSPSAFEVVIDGVSTAFVRIPDP